MRAFLAVLASALLLHTAGAQSQSEMNAEAAADFEKADKELNIVYLQVRKTLDKEGRDKLKAAQKAWLEFRDAQAEFRADNEGRGGSIYPLILFGTKAQMTESRIKELKEFLVPYEDR